MIERTKLTVEVDDEMPASGDLAGWITALYNALDPGQRYRVRQFLREREERRSTGDQ